MNLYDKRKTYHDYKKLAPRIHGPTSPPLPSIDDIRVTFPVKEALSQLIYTKVANYIAFIAVTHKPKQSNCIIHQTPPSSLI